MCFRMTSITIETGSNGHTGALFEGLVVPWDSAAALNRSWDESDGPDAGDELDWIFFGPTSDELFEEWLLALPFDAMARIHLQLCRLSVAKRAVYLLHWRFALPASLQLGHAGGRTRLGVRLVPHPRS